MTVSQLSVLSVDDAATMIREGNFQMSGFIIQNLHLKRETLVGIVEGCLFEDCTFQDCTFTINFRVFGVTFSNCNFENVKFEIFFGGSTTEGANTLMKGCSFNLKSVKRMAFGAHFSNCKIAGKFRDCQFQGNLENCLFYGSFVDVIIGQSSSLDSGDVTKIYDCDFSKLGSFGARFFCSDLARCVFPYTPEEIVVRNFQSNLKLLIEVGRIQNDANIIDSYSRELALCANKQDVGVINLNLLELYINYNDKYKEILGILKESQVFNIETVN